MNWKKVILCLLVSLFSLPIFAQTIDALYPADSIVSRYHNSWTVGSYKRRIVNFKKEPLKFNEVVFVGNSITQQGGDWSKKFGISHIRNRGIAGDLTDGVLHRLDEIIYYKPKAVFILIGVNDVFNMHHEKDTRFTYDKIVPSPKYIAKNIQKITKQIAKKSPHTQIYVRTVLPVRKDYGNEEILEVNRLIKQYEAKSPYTVIDLYSQFADQEGKMKKEFTKDGTHLNDEGYKHWVKFEKTIVQQAIDNYGNGTGIF